MDHKKINIFDYDHDILPEFKFDLVISLLSLDYHYDFQIYQNYLKKFQTRTLLLYLIQSELIILRRFSKV